jgi:hypothetical protein
MRPESDVSGLKITSATSPPDEDVPVSRQLIISNIKGKNERIFRNI